MTKINGMMARSTSFSAVNWEASLVKTAALISCRANLIIDGLTEAWCEQGHVEIRQKLL